jgi:hypothetical protein
VLPSAFDHDLHESVVATLGQLDALFDERNERGVSPRSVRGPSADLSSRFNSRGCGTDIVRVAVEDRQQVRLSPQAWSARSRIAASPLCTYSVFDNRSSTERAMAAGA